MALARGVESRPAGRQLLAVVRYELAVERRGRTMPAFAALFAIAALGLAFTGLSATGSLTVQGFARTAVSLLQLSLWVVPLITLATGALAAADGYDMELLAAQPLRRETLLVGRALGRLVAASGALLVGYGGAGLMIAGAAGTGDAWRYAALVAVTIALAAAGTSLGTLVGVLARTRARALALAFAVWFLLALGFDLAAITAIGVLPRVELSWTLSGFLVLNPVAAARAVGGTIFDAVVISGPTGAALRRVLGPWGQAVLWAGLAAWAALPLALAARIFARRDL